MCDHIARVMCVAVPCETAERRGSPFDALLYRLGVGPAMAPVGWLVRGWFGMPAAWWLGF